MSKSKKTKKHPADGLYYVTPRMLQDPETYACTSARHSIYTYANVPRMLHSYAAASASSLDRKIPVTYDLLKHVEETTTPIFWMAAYALREKGFPTPLRLTVSNIMDALLLRAKKEGLIP